MITEATVSHGETEERRQRRLLSREQMCEAIGLGTEVGRRYAPQGSSRTQITSTRGNRARVCDLRPARSLTPAEGRRPTCSSVNSVTPFLRVKPLSPYPPLSRYHYGDPVASPPISDANAYAGNGPETRRAVPAAVAAARSARR